MSASLAEQARRALERGDTRSAAQLARAAAAQNPQNADAWLILGAAQDQAGNANAANEAYRNCVKNSTSGNTNECAALLKNR
jgi:Flp pilus assembly protein TadD